jgi:hypothetical protein
VTDRLVNLTPHAIGLRREDGSTLILEPQADPARIVLTDGGRRGTVAGVELWGPRGFQTISGLPEPADGTVYVVSQLTAVVIAALYPHRTDIVYPDTIRGTDRDQRGVLATSRLIAAV